MSRRRRDGPLLRTEDEGDYVPSRNRVPPARQLCHGGRREVYERPKFDKCPVCERRVDIAVVSTGRRDPETRDLVMAYVIPSHLPKRES